jgi:hypothetical protein
MRAIALFKASAAPFLLRGVQLVQVRVIENRINTAGVPDLRLNYINSTTKKQQMHGPFGGHKSDRRMVAKVFSQLFAPQMRQSTTPPRHEGQRFVSQRADWEFRATVTKAQKEKIEYDN